MSDWYLEITEYKQAIGSWEKNFNSSNNLSKNKVTEISKQIEYIFNE